MAKKIAIILAGCGQKDGSEITEAVSALIALSEVGAKYSVFAPNKTFAVTDHLSSKPTGEERNLLNESARIARGEVQDLKELNPKNFDALVFPGGFGAALHLCTYAKDGAQCHVLPEVQTVIEEFYAQEKPIGAICIAPALIARVLGRNGITVTLGDARGQQEILKTGAQLEACAVTDFVTDRDHRIVSTPAYMFGDARPHEVFLGIRKAMRELVEMA